MQTITGEIVTPADVQSNSALTLTAFIDLHVHADLPLQQKVQ